jgi:hypothetical protein
MNIKREEFYKIVDESLSDNREEEFNNVIENDSLVFNGTSQKLRDYINSDEYQKKDFSLAIQKFKDYRVNINDTFARG